MKKRVLEVAFGTLTNGGVASVIMSIIEPLHRDIDFDVLCYNNPHKKRQMQLEEFGINYFNARPKWINKYLDFVLRPFNYFFYCISLFRKEKYDVVHCHDASEGGVILLAAKLFGVKKRIIHIHQTKSPKKRKNPIVTLYRRIQWLLFICCANEIVGCSEQACIDSFGKRRHKVINNGIDLKKFEYSLENKSRGLNFIHVGRMAYPKNQIIVLDIFAQILKEYPEARLTLIGEGVDLNYVKSKVKELNISSAVKFLPSDSDVPGEFKKANYMIFPSSFEGFGIVLIEAQAANVYCYASDACPATTDVGMIKYLPLSQGSEKWAQSIISDIRNGKKSVVDCDKLKMYDSSFIAEEYRNLYESI